MCRLLLQPYKTAALLDKLAVPNLATEAAFHEADVNEITVGDNTNIQDGVVIHVAKNNAAGKALPTTIGNNVTIGEPVRPAEQRHSFCVSHGDVIQLCRTRSHNSRSNDK